MMHRVLIALGTMIGLCGFGLVVLYVCTIHRQNECIAFLRVLADVRVGVTTRVEFNKTMTRFKSFESPTDASAYYGDKCFKGVGYGIDNSSLGRFLLLPETNLAAGVFFDSNNVVQGTSVTLDRSRIAIVTLEEQPEEATEVSTARASWNEGTQKLHLVIDQAHRQDLTHMSVSCFTSWLGCDTARKLYSGDN